MTYTKNVPGEVSREPRAEGSGGQVDTATDKTASLIGCEEIKRDQLAEVTLSSVLNMIVNVSFNKLVRLKWAHFGKRATNRVNVMG